MANEGSICAGLLYADNKGNGVNVRIPCFELFVYFEVINRGLCVSAVKSRSVVSVSLW